MAATRRLAAILAADVVGYSRLMRADEEGTHERFKVHRSELVFPKVREHHGRIVKYTGDGMLAEFPSIVEAVLCAVEVQCGMSRRNQGVPDDERISLRIGVNLGDVIAEPEDIYGDGVNVAARLEALAEPNGICISQTVYEQIRDKLTFPFEDIGQQQVKNISRPLHVFALRAEVIASLPLIEDSPLIPALSPVGAPRLSICVLPFANLSGDGDQHYLSDAITDDVTTDLSRIPDLVVISRNTAFSYRNKPIDSRQIGRELRVRYLLQGSVRRSGNRIRVNTQLIDTESDTHVWADRFDHATEDLLALQDDVTGQIAIALDRELVEAEASRGSDHPDVVDYVLRGRAALNKGSSRENISEAIELFEHALLLDDRSIDARIFLAHALACRVLEQMTDTVQADIDRTERLIEEVRHSPRRRSLAHFWKGQVLRVQNRYEAAIPEFKTAIELDRNSVLALASLGLCKFYTGQLEEVIPAQEQAIRLSPRDPYIANWFWRIGMVHLLQSRGDEAILWIERARSSNPRLAGPHAWLASASALQGDMQLAATELAAARRLSSDGRYSSVARLRAVQPYGKAQVLAEETFFAGLRKAGVPEE
jgi:TolB-like protein/class 3 adenylate cyclase/Flp pilus assembly protein TadD